MRHFELADGRIPTQGIDLTPKGDLSCVVEIVKGYIRSRMLVATFAFSFNFTGMENEENFVDC